MINIQKTNHNLAAVFKQQFFRKLIKFAAVIAVVASFVIFLFFFVKYQVKDIRLSRADRQWLIKSLNGIVELNNNQAKADQMISEFEKMAPTAVEIPTKMIPQLKEDALAKGLKIDIRIGTLHQPENGEPAGVDFSLRADGDIKNLIDFFMGFENNRLIKAFQWDLLPID
ncbi:MAG: hypothetical protein HYW34_03855, partial [Candidatus Brennerbacteria bacterium]|nr:hypothetical protein [Candidatus Brennerbacteria bacterium]